MRLMPQGEFVSLPQALLKFRVHGGSISKSAAEVQGQLCESIRLLILKEIFPQDWAKAQALIAGVTRSGAFSWSDAFSLLGLLAEHRLLNAETAAWLGLNSLRALCKKPSA